MKGLSRSEFKYVLRDVDDGCLFFFCGGGMSPVTRKEHGGEIPGFLSGWGTVPKDRITPFAVVVQL